MIDNHIGILKRHNEKNVLEIRRMKIIRVYNK
jgi:hypothetical protein